MKNPLVRDLMTREVTVVRSDVDILELEQILLRHGVHGVPVVDGAGRIVGVVSQTDVLAWHYEADVDGIPFYDRPDDRGLERLNEHRPQPGGGRTATIAEVMSPLVHCIGPDKPIAEAAARMVREHVHRLVVVNDGYAVVGILSATDVLRAVPGVTTALAATA